MQGDYPGRRDPCHFVPRFHKRSPGRMEPRRDTRAAVLAGFLGWTLDEFDFFLVVMCLTAIAAEFGRRDKDVAFTLTMTLAFRPVGAFVLGLHAVRYGPRLPLMHDLMLYYVV